MEFCPRYEWIRTKQKLYILAPRYSPRLNCQERCSIVWSKGCVSLFYSNPWHYSEGTRLSSSSRCLSLQSMTPEKKNIQNNIALGYHFTACYLRHLLSKEHLRKASSIPEINRNAGKGEYILIIIPQWELSWWTYWTLRAELPVTLQLCMTTHFLCSTHSSCPSVFFCGNPWERLITWCGRQILDFKNCTISLEEMFM